MSATLSDEKIPSDGIERTVDRDFDTLQVAFLRELVRVPSDNPPGDCAPHGRFAAERLETLGFVVERDVVPPDVLEQSGLRSATNLIIRQRFGNGYGPVVALNAHDDVVPPGGGWTHDPYAGVIEEGRLYGRGAAVSKSDFATFAFALRALNAHAEGLQGQVELHFTYDEETGGSAGPGRLLELGMTRPDYVISAGFTYGVMIAHKGSLQLDVTFTGKSAHSAWPDTGCDAIQAACGVMVALYAHRDALAARPSIIPGIGAPTLVIGTISGGVAANVVPEQATFRIERRIMPDEDADEVERELRDIILRAVTVDGVTCAVCRHLLALPLVPESRQAPLVAALQDAAETVVGERIPAEGMPLFTDARLYSNAGCPTVLYGAGPRRLQDANGHRADEHVVLEDMRRATKVVAIALWRLLGRPGTQS
ncbi:ArgE/DapE family deacylase [Gluconacetobacter diazotrophicus]|uniref:Probable succinyl-diaminopimelate desuccinylase n=1 Tax=Gluconacetobacter diazotrophicus (strain ATCC 49037 / DSM 5601 / CCUG 37298 / CIP 103539 / LMG 7603 / PAl5) TaxID=272568 RepID=A9HPX9_GLUDA|nr:ArgE/DapE family deacylase [Gluconacetobacter diazotrophicus]CAP56646.1 putative peptidase [Gluconacetobacter diazotrophicus PA1 5]